MLVSYHFNGRLHHSQFDIVFSHFNFSSKLVDLAVVSLLSLLDTLQASNQLLFFFLFALLIWIHFLLLSPVNIVHLVSLNQNFQCVVVSEISLKPL